MKINLNDLAVEIAKREGLKEQVNIAQIKEIIKYTLRELKKATLEELIELFKRIK